MNMMWKSTCVWPCSLVSDGRLVSFSSFYRMVNMVSNVISRPHLNISLSFSMPRRVCSSSSFMSVTDVSWPYTDNCLSASGIFFDLVVNNFVNLFSTAVIFVWGERKFGCIGSCTEKKQIINPSPPQVPSRPWWFRPIHRDSNAKY